MSAALLLAALLLALTVADSVRACEADDPAVEAPEEFAVEDTAEDADASGAAFPAECRDMPALVRALQSQTFKPSMPVRWNRYAAMRWEATAPVVPEAEGEPGRCDIEKVHGDDVSSVDFKQRYLERKPVIIVNATDITEFQVMTSKSVILYCYADFDVTLSTANKNSYAKTEASFRFYVEAMMKPTTLDASGVGSKYFFGDNRHAEWDALFKHYRRPQQYIWSHTSLSFGSGGSGSGVPFHTHGHVFAEVFHGRKRWFLQEPGPEPRFDPDESSLRWATVVAPTIPAEDRAKILECVCGPGELLYIPSHWHHSTLNLGESVFMSAFV